jgi:hypothetical protein
MKMANKVQHHGMTHAKGCDHLRLGNFSRLFSVGGKNGCPAVSVTEAEAAALGGEGGIMHDIDGGSPDSGIAAAYTFFAQFIDHDITLDTTTKLHGTPLKEAEICKLPNLRSPSLDLDCVYGFGPEAQPFMYDQSAPGRMIVGNDINPNDLPRNSDGRALIGDPRNDENLFVSQLQLLFIRFHNRRIMGRSFEKAQQDVRFHYQYIVLHDFLRQVCDEEVYEFACQRLQDNQYEVCEATPNSCGGKEEKYALKKAAYPLVYKPDECGRLPMPVEFSVAAYRFGHSMVRSQYPANADYPVIELFDERFGTLGFSAVPPKLKVDWRFLLDVDSCTDYVKSKGIDHLIADELIRLPDPVVGRLASENDRSLAFRNLLRGHVLSLPSGQCVAQKLHAAGYTMIAPNQDLKFNEIPRWQSLPSAMRTKFQKETPLFFYVMREAGVNGCSRLGKVGSAILLEVFGGMLTYCQSYLREPGWSPDPCIASDKELTLADIVRYVQG